MATENFHPLPFTFPPITHRGLKESLEKTPCESTGELYQRSIH